MTAFASAVFALLGSDLILSLIGCAVPALAVGTVCAVFRTKGD